MARKYIKELGDKKSHGVAATEGDRVKTIAPVYYMPSDSSSDSDVKGIQTELDKKEDKTNKTTSVRAASSASDTLYPTEKAVATALAGKATKPVRLTFTLPVAPSGGTSVKYVKITGTGSDYRQWLCSYNGNVGARHSAWLFRSYATGENARENVTLLTNGSTSDRPWYCAGANTWYVKFTNTVTTSSFQIVFNVASIDNSALPTLEAVDTMPDTATEITVYGVTKAEQLRTARQLAVSLSNTGTTTTFDGTANVTNIKVSGTLGVGNGGTGKTTVTAGNYLVGNGSSALTEKTPAQVLSDIGAQAALSFDGTYNASSNKAATVSTVTNAIDALDVPASGTGAITGMGAGKTLASLTETNGKVAATFQDISITKSQVSDFSHTHGNITNDGKVGTNADYAVVTTTGGAVTATSLATSSPSTSGNTLEFIDTVSQNSKGKISATKKKVTIDDTYSSTGTNPVSGKAVAAAIETLDVTEVGGDGKYIKKIKEDNGKITATVETMDTTPTASSTKAVTSSGIKTALDGKVDFQLLNDTTLIGTNSPAADCKAYWENASMPDNHITAVYNIPGNEATLLFSKRNKYGSILKYGYADKYIYLLRNQNHTWQSDGWEKINAGYADSAGTASNYNTSSGTIKTALDGKASTALDNVTANSLANLYSITDGFARHSNKAAGYGLLATIDYSNLGGNTDINAVFELYDKGSNQVFTGRRYLVVNIRNNSSSSGASGTYVYKVTELIQAPVWERLSLKVYRTDNTDIRIYSLGAGTGYYGGMVCKLVSCTSYAGDSRYTNITMHQGAATDTVPSGTEIPITIVTEDYSAIPDTYRSIIQDISKGANLVVNGSGRMASNYNFSGTTYFPTICNNGSAGSFGFSGQATSNEYISVDFNKRIFFSCDIKNLVEQPSGCWHRIYVNEYDIDKLSIVGQMVLYGSGTLTTLAEDLNPGDTTVHITDASHANWQSTTTHHKGLIFWNYANSYGYVYPPETYSRNVYPSGDTQSLWDDGGVNASTGIITLKTAWSGPTIPAGTKVSRRSSGANYPYPAQINTRNTNWHTISGYMEGVCSAGENVRGTGKFSCGTAFIRVGMYPSSLNNTDSTTDKRAVFTNFYVYELPMSAPKITTARKLAVSLSNTSTDTSFDGSADVTNIKTTGTLPVTNGGTGKTTVTAAEYNLLSKMGTDLSANDILDTYRFVFASTSPSESNGRLAGFRTATAVWNWAKGKIKADSHCLDSDDAIDIWNSI